MTDDPHELSRFVEAQDSGSTYQRALTELRNGRKTSHWMWFVFPQLDGLGRSAMSRRYAIASVDEARAYLAHPVLGDRLRECAQLLAEADAGPQTMLGGIDAMKLQSSMTLFHLAAPEEPAFAAVLARHYGGQLDPETERRLGSAG
jgi:uncharacterized protein (DUF1810 family)